MTDNALSFWKVHYYHSVLTDGYSSLNHPFSKQFWPSDYTGIRAANQFLNKARESVIGNATKEGDDNHLYDHYRAEARLLRAIFHFDLACWFGDVAIIGDNEDGTAQVIDPSDHAAMNRKRTPCADVLKWVADECDAVKDILPFRYAEVLLNAAEALNEAQGPDKAYAYVNEVRSRVGMPAYKGMTKEQLRERIRNERRIELCFEDHRFFDERRWKLFEGRTPASEKALPHSEQVYNLYGVTVTVDNGKTTYTYGSAGLHPVRVFNSPKNYYLPLPDSEVKACPNLGQNPGWELAKKEADTSAENKE